VRKPQKIEAGGLLAELLAIAPDEIQITSSWFSK
jgi:hypothetical protein